LYIHVPKCAGTSVEKHLERSSDFSFLFHKTIKHEFRCNPQHFHAPLLKQIIKDVEAIPSFMIVRHPLLRAMSEHGYQKTQGYSGDINFEAHVKRFFFRYSFDTFTYDNHIRPQNEFHINGAKVFRLEEGLKRPLEYCYSVLTPNVDNNIDESSNHRTNMSIEDTYTVTGRTINSVQNFYEADFSLFGYQKITIKDNEKINSSELKHEIKAHKLEKLKNDEVTKTEGLNTYKPARVLQTLDRTLLLTTRLFKAVEKII
jgi:hypothetical protein